MAGTTTASVRGERAMEGRYPRDWRQCLVIVFDLRVPGVVERLQEENAAWRDNGHVEALDLDHHALIVRPGVTQGGRRERP